MKIALVGSSGGHLSHLLLLKDFWSKHDRFWVTFEKEDAIERLRNERKYWCFYPTNRNIINLIKNYRLAKKILKQEQPDLIISTGAGAAIPYFLLAKKMNIKTVFIEVFDRINNPTLTARIVKRYTNLFIVQWPEQEKNFKKSINLGSIY